MGAMREAAGNVMDRFERWISDDPSSTRAFIKVVGSAAAAVSALTAPFVLYLHLAATQNLRELQQTLNDLDGRPTVVFNSVADGVRKGYAEKDCVASEAAARAWMQKEGTGVSYSSYQACAEKHGTALEDVSMLPGGVTMVPTGQGGMMPVSTPPTTIISYKPPMVGWQAAQDDLQVAVPLYASPKANTGLRQDGRAFSLTP